MKCPYCNKESIDKVASDAITALLVKHGCTGNMCNPGGREFLFPFGRVQVSDYCHHCDLEKLKDRIAELST